MIHSSTYGDPLRIVFETDRRLKPSRVLAIIILAISSVLFSPANVEAAQLTCPLALRSAADKARDLVVQLNQRAADQEARRAARKVIPATDYRAHVADLQALRERRAAAVYQGAEPEDVPLPESNAAKLAALTSRSPRTVEALSQWLETANPRDTKPVRKMLGRLFNGVEKNPSQVLKGLALIYEIVHSEPHRWTDMPGILRNFSAAREKVTVQYIQNKMESEDALAALRDLGLLPVPKSPSATEKQFNEFKQVMNISIGVARDLFMLPIDMINGNLDSKHIRAMQYLTPPEGMTTEASQIGSLKQISDRLAWNFKSVASFDVIWPYARKAVVIGALAYAIVELGIALAPSAAGAYNDFAHDPIGYPVQVEQQWAHAIGSTVDTLKVIPAQIVSLIPTPRHPDIPFSTVPPVQVPAVVTDAPVAASGAALLPQPSQQNAQQSSPHADDATGQEMIDEMKALDK